MPSSTLPSGPSSASTPASLRSSQTTSLGQLRRRPAPNARAHSTAAMPPARLSTGSSCCGRCGRSRIETSSAVPAGASQLRPRRPRPARWRSARTAVKAGAPAAASSAQLVLRRVAALQLVDPDWRLGHLATIGAVTVVHHAIRARGDREDHPAPRPVPAHRRGRRARAGRPRARPLPRYAATNGSCAGTFPGDPIMPGVLMVEALAQAGAVGVLSHPDFLGRVPLFAGIDDVRFRRVVRPGDVLDFELTVDRLRRTFGQGHRRSCAATARRCSTPSSRSASPMPEAGSRNGARVGV